MNVDSKFKSEVQKLISGRDSSAEFIALMHDKLVDACDAVDDIDEATCIKFSDEIKVAVDIFLSGERKFRVGIHNADYSVTLSKVVYSSLEDAVHAAKFVKSNANKKCSVSSYAGDTLFFV